MKRYFIWDTIDSARHSTIGFVVHGTSLFNGHGVATDDTGACCLAVYLFSFVCLPLYNIG